MFYHCLVVDKMLDKCTLVKKINSSLKVIFLAFYHLNRSLSIGIKMRHYPVLPLVLSKVANEKARSFFFGQVYSIQ